MLDKQSYKLREKFNKKLLSFLSLEGVMIQKLNKPIDKYIGDEFKKFTQNASNISDWAKRNRLISKKNPEWKSISEALKLWTGLAAFISKAKIEEGDDYLKEIDTYEINVKKIYENGKETFLMGNKGTIGQMETAYMHILCYNLAEHARITFKRHGVGIGVFNLQGYK